MTIKLKQYFIITLYLLPSKVVSAPVPVVSVLKLRKSLYTVLLKKQASQKTKNAIGSPSELPDNDARNCAWPDTCEDGEENKEQDAWQILHDNKIHIYPSLPWSKF